MPPPSDLEATLPLGTALRGILYHPLRLLAAWNWKTAAVSAVLRAAIFFFSNHRAGSGPALKAMLVEAVWATLAAGFAGAVTQRLRHAVPVRRTVLVVWLALPLCLLVAQLTVHRAMRTPHLRTGVLASFVFAALSSGFNWFAMARGAFVTGEHRSFTRDLHLVPRLLADFLAAPFR